MGYLKWLGCSPARHWGLDEMSWSESEWQSLSSVQLIDYTRNSPGQNTGVGSLSLLCGIFPTQGSNPGLQHCRQILYQLSHNGSIYTYTHTLNKVRKTTRSFRSDLNQERRETKGKGEKERYIYLNAEFQRIVRRDNKAFLSEQCKQIEENNRMGKTRDLFKKMRYQGNISCKDGHTKGQKWYGPNRSRRY